jgi:hypothetical protein
MAGKALVNFADFVQATNERVLTPPSEILSEATKRTYLFGDMMNGYDADVVIQAGKKITDRLQMNAGSQFGFYHPNETFSPVIEDLLSDIEANWRFAKDAWAWTDQEIELNVGGATGDARYTQFKQLKRSKQQGCEISLYNGLDTALWATPDNAQMETSTGKRPYSIRAFITEDGLAPSGFTTVMGVNPSTESKWRNQVTNYDPSLIDVQLVPAFEDMWLRLKFKSPKRGSKSFKETDFRKFLIPTNLEGRKTYVRLTREANDNPVAAGRGDLGWALSESDFGGISVEYIEELDNVGYAAGQPRYFWLNFLMLHPVMHGTRWMHETNPIHGGTAQPYSHVVYKDCWYNLFCRSRRRLGIVCPE